MELLKLNLFQETACYKKPFAFKVAETYPLPPYSTIIGMFHKILQAKSGEYYPMRISVQGEFESIFSNYQNLRMYKQNGEVTAMPRNVHQLLNVKLILHVQAEEEIIKKLYENITTGKESFSLGRNEDMVRVDKIDIMKNIKEVPEAFVTKNAYIPIKEEEDIKGISYRLNTKYTIDKNNLRHWEKVNVKYVEKNNNILVEDVLQDEEGDFIFLF